MHSSYSDGALAPQELVAAAIRGGLDLMALADHDTAAGVRPAIDAARDRIHVLPAIEVSTTHGDTDLHVLGYGIDPDNADLTSYARRASARREERIGNMTELLAGLGLELQLDDVRRAAGDARALARPHLARAMMQRGLVSSVTEAFDRYIGDRGPAFLPTSLPPPANAIDLIHRAGGIAVWAHPPLDGIDGMLGPLIRAGLDGIECHRPRLTNSEISKATRVARRNSVLITGGSDWHGPWNGELGSFFLEAGDVDAFLERAGI